MKRRPGAQRTAPPAPAAEVSRRAVVRYAALAGLGAVIASCRRGLVLTDESQLATAALTDWRAATELALRATDTPSARKSTPRPAPSARDLGVDSDLRLTANEDFYTMKFHPSPPPELDRSAWRLEVSGQVGRPLSLSLAELSALPVATFMRTLECISNPAGGNLIGNAVWRGVRLADVLALAAPRPAAQYLKLTSADDYHTGIPLELALDPRSYLVFEMNGERLPAAHGFPLRCLFPGRYGQKQPKWLTGIALQTEPHAGHWEQQGWSDTAFIQINSRIDGATRPERAGAPVVVRGIAFSGVAGVASVDLRGGPQGDVTPPRSCGALPSPSPTWFGPSGSGRGPILRRASTSSRPRRGTARGLAQRHPRANLLSGTFPDGTSDMQQVTVQVPGA